MFKERGLPGLRGTDHIGFTVPDMDEAHEFFVNLLGCDHVYSLGPMQPSGRWMSSHLNIHDEAVIHEIRFYRCFNGANFEVFHYSSPDQRSIQPKNSDIGGHHIAFYVDDIDEAINYLKDQKVEVLGDATNSSGASAGQRWVYFLSPWGMQFELVSYPAGKAYEPGAQTLLWDPRI
ncbi:VOC family protein [Paeniglutamicibacter sulfureus]|uniref:VOC family protein n=1 Tax=Paeniglutamicibacter sulfureus TaxID=43666 RepID=UPI0026665B29|nr:VOC family protein [Paeniglutamicibacter sulfureus]MDO2934677.1 VOC family protein [Paeniglutamicibacter sulfureus]